MLIGVSSPAVCCAVGRGRNITVYSTDSNEEKHEWLTQLLCSLITLLQGYTGPQLETFTTGGQADCVILTILRSLSHEQLEELRPAADIHRECTEDVCQGQPPISMGKRDESDKPCLSESNSTTMEIDELYHPGLFIR